jgi:type II secretory pathway component PulF
MNFWRGSIIAIWVMFHLGGYLFVEMMHRQMKVWQDFGAELSLTAVLVITAADLLAKYWYLFSIVLTIVCAVFWNVGSTKGTRLETAD